MAVNVKMEFSERIVRIEASTANSGLWDAPLAMFAFRSVRQTVTWILFQFGRVGEIQFAPSTADIAPSNLFDQYDERMWEPSPRFVGFDFTPKHSGTEIQLDAQSMGSAIVGLALEHLSGLWS
ncbi:MAG: hypothetical protein ABUS57_06600, partial [Pseudomonadota bacterium]